MIIDRTLNDLQKFGFDRPTMSLQKKFNLNLLLTDFNIHTGTGWERDPRLTGLFVYNRTLPQEYKYFYAPTNPFESYLRCKKGNQPTLIPITYNTFYDMRFFDELIIVSDTHVAPIDFNYQFFLSNILSINVVDEYEEIVSIPANTNYTVHLPFPTYNTKVLIYINNNPTSFTYTLMLSPYRYNMMGAYNETFDFLAAIAGTGMRINNYYDLNDVGGTGLDVTVPHLAFPSFDTIINIHNDDVGVAIDDCRIKVYSYLKIGGF